MPENVEQPGQAPEAPEAAAPRKARKAAAPRGAAAVAYLKQKYRLDEKVNVMALGSDNKALGIGPLLDSEVIRKFASLDKSQDKRYLDWMLFQAGGGPEAFQGSLDQWGIGIPPVSPQELVSRFIREGKNKVTNIDVGEISRRRNLPTLSANVNSYLKTLTMETLPQTYQEVLATLREQQIAAGNEDKVAQELLGIGLKRWLKEQREQRVRDRVHTLFIWARVMKGAAPETVEADWAAAEQNRQREYCFGDEDSVKWKLFGFFRHWPGGKEQRYEKIYSAMDQFLINKDRVERRNATLDWYNEKIKLRNQGLPPERQAPMRAPIKMDLDIGEVTLTPDIKLKYKGRYAKVEDLAKANTEMADLPMREKVQGDVRYAGPKGKVGSGERIYSDSNVDVIMPLTLAASIQAGHQGWPISSPDQIGSALGGSATPWTLHHAGLDAYGGAGEAALAEFRKIPIMFHVKAEAVPEDRMLMVIGINDLVELRPPYDEARFKLGNDKKTVTLRELVRVWKSSLDRPTYLGLMRSFVKAIRALQEWGMEFEPEQIIADPVAHHKEKMGMRTGLRAECIFRAKQVVDLLLT